MCGIVGIVSKEKKVVSNILNSLVNLEYRGYDSSGIAVLSDSQILCAKVVGKIENLIKAINIDLFESNVGIGHTRWATHGKVSDLNAHPHFTDNVAIVHNGVIENYAEIKLSLEKEGYTFKTETDTEVVLFLIDKFILQGNSPIDSVINSIKLLRGSYSLAIIFKNHNNLMLGVKKGSPLIIGKSDRDVVLSSDVASVSHLVSNIAYLNDDMIVEIENKHIKVYDVFKSEIPLVFQKISNEEQYENSKSGYSHFMLKEIIEQPKIIKKLCSNYDNVVESVKTLNLHHYKKIIIVACGTSYYAALTAKYWFENMTSVDVMVYAASEFCYLSKKLNDDYLVIFISQSGETADTLSSLRYVKSLGVQTIGIINAKNSSINNEADFCFYTEAGQEIGVASTKAFTAQITILLQLVLSIGYLKNEINLSKIEDILSALKDIDKKIDEIFNKVDLIKDIAKYISQFSNVIYIARQNATPIAFEAALKLKEISYIHAEGYSAGELKHGPLALIDDKMIVVVIANSKSHVHLKTISNLENILSRKGNVILCSDVNILNNNVITFSMPDIIDELTPILYSIPMQLLAFYTALQKGTDIDKPRNLAKSVTVE